MSADHHVQSVEQLRERLVWMINYFLEDPPAERLSESACLRIAAALVHRHFSEVTWVAEELELIAVPRPEQCQPTGEESGDA